MIFLRRFRDRLDERYAQGVKDGQAGRSPNPFRPTEWDYAYGLVPYERWAYDAGHRDGRAALMRQAGAIQQAAGQQ